MALILNIDTATEYATISIAEDGKVLQLLENNKQKEHASFLHTGIKQLLNSCASTVKDITAIAVINGPGSYTGIRVGMASAKGLCFALHKPLITINTLTVMAHSALQNSNTINSLLCPLLDARRMEAFFALYDSQLNILISPRVIELHDNFLKEFLDANKILFIGNAVEKFEKICNHSNASFNKLAVSPASMAILSYYSFKITEFDDVSYSDPVYLKEFYHPNR